MLSLLTGYGMKLCFGTDSIGFIFSIDSSLMNFFTSAVSFILFTQHCILSFEISLISLEERRKYILKLQID